ncbi:MAG: E3 binding domain-containing protein [Nocardioides sp.]
MDLDSVTGTGRAGTITKADVRRAAAAVEAAAASQPSVPPVPTPVSRPRVTPYARRLARELGVDLASVAPHEGDRARGRRPGRGSWAGCRRPTRGPEAEAPEPTTPVPTGPTVPRTEAAARALAMRETIARLMARSKREIPHYYLTATVDMSEALEWMRTQNATLPLSERLVPAALMLRATALALVKHPS